MLISFDLWGTLIKTNPTFKAAKIKFLQDYLEDSYTAEEILDAFKKTKTQINYLIESTGWQPSRSLIFEYLIFNITGKLTKINVNEIDVLYQNLSKDFIPNLFSEETKEILKNISKKHTVVLSSNTMFIKGLILKSYLKELNILPYIKEFKFSDELGISKPHPLMYYTNTDFHIGDNLLTDKAGPERVGIKSIIINSNKKTIKDAYDILLKNQ